MQEQGMDSLLANMKLSSKTTWLFLLTLNLPHANQSLRQKSLTFNQSLKQASLSSESSLHQHHSLSGTLRTNMFLIELDSSTNVTKIVSYSFTCKAQKSKSKVRQLNLKNSFWMTLVRDLSKKQIFRQEAVGRPSCHNNLEKMRKHGLGMNSISRESSNLMSA